MISRRLSVRPETWVLNEPFHISRGSRTEAHLITAELEHCKVTGCGEAAPYARYGETIDSVMTQLADVTDAVEDGVSPEELQALLPAGAARNAVDCALWDMLARWKGTSVAEMLDLPRPRQVDTAVTIGIGDAATMAVKAKRYKDYPLLKIKLNREDITGKIKAIRAEAPTPRIIIDPNESWTIEDITELDSFMAEMNISVLEQPLAAGQDEGLRDFKGKVPVCADESCHTRADLDGLQGKYQVINIKLDKTGGLTEAVKLKQQATDMGFDIMVGCMISTSLAMAPALLLASDATFVDLDGPLWMKEDRAHGLDITQGCIAGLSPDLWGG
ncbi:N-acetyl-D-Glu racemase DgcA [Paremcibacter congregatus]|uniref:N-acetyl-D-Glu racemase DgcA n=1 Tax=Paremcibacter congregatus TaxID=2043170 RepID=UPI0030EE3359|tara:strand:- start:10517 stop:11506 length:990 start_codon:yes stop_codon:yes gene_type:complete